MHVPIKAISVLSQYFHPLPFRPSISQLLRSDLDSGAGPGGVCLGGVWDACRSAADTGGANTALEQMLLRDIHGSQPEGLCLCSESLRRCGVDQEEGT